MIGDQTRVIDPDGSHDKTFTRSQLAPQHIDIHFSEHNIPFWIELLVLVQVFNVKDKRQRFFMLTFPVNLESIVISGNCSAVRLYVHVMGDTPEKICAQIVGTCVI